MTKVIGKCNECDDSWEREYIGPHAAIMDTIDFLVGNTGLTNIDLRVDIRDDGVVGPERLIMTAGSYEMTIDLKS